MHSNGNEGEKGPTDMPLGHERLAAEIAERQGDEEIGEVNPFISRIRGHVPDSVLSVLDKGWHTAQRVASTTVNVINDPRRYLSAPIKVKLADAIDSSQEAFDELVAGVERDLERNLGANPDPFTQEGLVRKMVAAAVTIGRVAPILDPAFKAPIVKRVGHPLVDLDFVGEIVDDLDRIGTKTDKILAEGIEESVGNCFHRGLPLEVAIKLISDESIVGLLVERTIDAQSSVFRGRRAQTAISTAIKSVSKKMRRSAQEDKALELTFTVEKELQDILQRFDEAYNPNDADLTVSRLIRLVDDDDRFANYALRDWWRSKQKKLAEIVVGKDAEHIKKAVTEKYHELAKRHPNKFVSNEFAGFCRIVETSETKIYLQIDEYKLKNLFFNHVTKVADLANDLDEWREAMLRKFSREVEVYMQSGKEVVVILANSELEYSSEENTKERLNNCFREIVNRNTAIMTSNLNDRFDIDPLHVSPEAKSHFEDWTNLRDGLWNYEIYLRGFFGVNGKESLAQCAEEARDLIRDVYEGLVWAFKEEGYKDAPSWIKAMEIVDNPFDLHLIANKHPDKQVRYAADMMINLYGLTYTHDMDRRNVFHNYDVEQVGIGVRARGLTVHTKQDGEEDVLDIYFRDSDDAQEIEIFDGEMADEEDFEHLQLSKADYAGIPCFVPVGLINVKERRKKILKMLIKGENRVSEKITKDLQRTTIVVDDIESLKEIALSIVRSGVRVVNIENDYEDEINELPTSDPYKNPRKNKNFKNFEMEVLIPVYAADGTRKYDVPFELRMHLVRDYLVSCSKLHDAGHKAYSGRKIYAVNDRFVPRVIDPYFYKAVARHQNALWEPQVTYEHQDPKSLPDDYCIKDHGLAEWLQKEKKKYKVSSTTKKSETRTKSIDK